MAKIGMKYPTYAVEKSYTPGSAITYNAGKTFAHAISSEVTPNRRDNPLYGDDVKIENDKGMTDYSIRVGVDRIPIADRATLLGEKAQGGSTPTHYSVLDINPPYVGYGYVRVMQEDNAPKYEGYWFHRVQFALDSDGDNTKGASITWGTYTMTGTGFGVVLDSSGDTQFYDHMEFASEAAAYAWVKGRANIS